MRKMRKCRIKCNKKKLANSLDNRMQYKNVIPIEFLLSTELSKIIEIPNVITLLRNEVGVSIKVIENTKEIKDKSTLMQNEKHCENIHKHL